jgi:FMN reductase
MSSIVLVASATYEGTYTGLPKVSLDRLPGRAPAGAAELPLPAMGAIQPEVPR